ncbi:MAG: GNAT family N-acetyltransferase [Pseudonocardiales bacterium]
MTRSPAAKMGPALTVGALAVAVLMPITASATEAPGASSLRLAAIEYPGLTTEIVVAVPAGLAAQPLPTSAFQVTQAGSTLPLTVQRVADAGLEVYIVLDTAVAKPTLAAEQSAASELLRKLPPAVRTAAVGSGAGYVVPSAQPGNVTALHDLSVITPRPTTSLNPTLTAIATLHTDGRRRVIVLMTDCHATGAAHLRSFGAALGHAGSDQQLDVVAPGSDCARELPSLAARSGGLSVLGQSLARLDQAVDTLLLDLLGQYRLSVLAAARGPALTVTVDQGGVRASTVVAAASARRRIPAPAPAHKGGGASRVLLATLVVLVLIVAIAVVAIVSRRFRRRPPARAQVPWVAVQPAREGAGPPPPRPVVPEGSPTPTERAPKQPFRWSPAALPGFVSTGVTDRTVRLRLPEIGDAPALQAYAEHADGTADGWVPVPGDDDDDWIALLDDWLQTWRAEPGDRSLSLLVERCQDRRVVGYVGLRVSPCAVDISYGTAPPWRRRGYATRALKLIANWLTDNNPGRPVQAVIPQEHEASCNVARRAGFDPRGVNRTFVPETGEVELNLLFVFRPGAGGGPPP